jgi:ABC-type transport system substrate-binding protein
MLRTVMAAGLAGSLCLAASVAPARAESVLKIKNTGDIKQLDALFTSAYPVRDMAYLIYDTLFSLGRQLPRPAADGRKPHALRRRQDLCLQAAPRPELP